MRILLTGTCGGIGSTFAFYAIKNGHEIVAVDNLHNGYLENLERDGVKLTNFFKKDISNTEALIKIIKKFKIDSIVHLAAITSLPECEENPEECYRNNTLGTLSVLEAARRTGITKVVFASTSAVYENNNPNSWFKAYIENDDVNYPILAYPLSKKLAENICFNYSYKFGIKTPILRFFNVFGPNQDIYRKSPPLINYITREIINNRIPILHSNGKQSRDYVYIDDVCKSIEAALKEGKSRVYNVCSGELLSVNDIFKIISKVLKFNKKPKFNKAKNLWKDYNINIDSSLIEKETNKNCLGSNHRIRTELNIEFSKNIKELVGETALKIVENYDGK